MSLSLQDVILLLAAVISFITDIRHRKILNKITFPAIIGGIAIHTAASGWEGLLHSTAGMMLGFALLLIPYLLGGMGAGDVKLIAAIGALQGMQFVLYSFIYTTLIGGLIACFILMKEGRLQIAFRRIFYSLGIVHGSTGSLNVLDRSDLHQSIPYAVPITIGTVLAYFWGGWLW